MIYLPKPKPRFKYSAVIVPFVGILIAIVVSNRLDKKQARRAKEIEKASSISILQETEKNLNRKIIQHYEKIDSLINVRDSVNYEHSTKTVKQLQQHVDSLFNR